MLTSFCILKLINKNFGDVHDNLYIVKYDYKKLNK